MQKPEDIDFEDLAWRLYDEGCFENTYGGESQNEFVDFSNVTFEELEAFLQRVRQKAHWKKDELAEPDFAVWDQIKEEYGNDAALIAYLQMIQDQCPVEVQRKLWPEIEAHTELLKIQYDIKADRFPTE
jgi:hypothetical protein